MTTYLMSMKPPLRLASVAKTRWGVDFWNQHRNNVWFASQVIAVSTMVLVIPAVKLMK
jgi:hypothetical protein